MIRIDSPRGLATALRQLRRDAGLLQADVAERAGCHPARISHAECYHRGIGIPVTIRHLGALGYGLAIVPLDQGGPSGPTCAPQSDETASGVAAYGTSDSNAAEARTEGGGWDWTPTADGGYYSGPHGPDICPAMGCRHEGGAA